MNSGYSKVSYLEALQISDYTKTSTENGLPLPAWLRPIYPNPLSQMTTQTFGVMAKEYVNLGCGFLLKKITEDALKKSTGSLLPITRKIMLYSGHDMNIHYMLTAFNLWSAEAVEYGAYLLFELHKINNVYGFIIYYNNNRPNTRLLIIPGCKSFCPLDKFIELTSHIYKD